MMIETSETHSSLGDYLKIRESDLQSLLFDIVRSAAFKAILPLYQRGLTNSDIGYKDNNDIVTAADTEMQSRLIDAFSRYWPNIGVLSEEQPIEIQCTVFNDKKRPYWVLDPIDGTSNFAFGIPYFCTSLALIFEGEIRVGLVYDPIRDECFYASQGNGTTLNGVKLPGVAQLNQSDSETDFKSAIAMVDFKRLPQTLAAELAAKPPYRSQRSFGASALDWCWIAANRCQLYLHGEQKLWDYAAGSLILSEAGGMSSSYDGSNVFNQSMQARSVIAATQPAQFEQWQQHISQHL
ncbi:inositol monophosphatase [Grimontia kaedaensis]|uniref:Inositol monophosphatase n=1 Tax=Grimontia kaedaensis TaxID=2872157 RepID=A0ABY4WYE2_9GAMM|nr:inositol monophosphatase [Grimontia kaedaensis]USH04024.1 inositol monophosphatase [Grimontia kaedaensis]